MKVGCFLIDIFECCVTSGFLWQSSVLQICLPCLYICFWIFTVLVWATNLEFNGKQWNSYFNLITLPIGLYAWYVVDFFEHILTDKGRPCDHTLGCMQCVEYTKMPLTKILFIYFFNQFSMMAQHNILYNLRAPFQ